MGRSRILFLLMSLVFIFLLPAPNGQAREDHQGVTQRVAALETAVDELRAQLRALTQQIAALSEQIVSDQARLGTLEQAGLYFDIPVNCAEGQTVASALAQAASHTGLVSITITGTCHESILTSRSNTWFRGAQPGAGITAATASPNSIALSVTQATRVFVDGLTLSGGGFGIKVTGNAWVRVAGGALNGNLVSGAFADEGTIILLNTTVADNGGPGVLVWPGSTIRIDGGLITNNATSGVELHGGVAQVSLGARIAGNQRGGLVLHASTIDVRAATIEGNTGDGVQASVGSRVVLNNGALIQNNTGNGLMLSDTSVAYGLGAGPGMRIIANGGWGLFCSPAPAVAQYLTPLADISGNHAGNVSCPSTPKPPIGG